MTTELPDINCKSCQHSYAGHHCPSCGQKHIDKRITVKDSLKHWVGSFFNYERGMWHTIWLLLKDPRKIITEYFDGITKPYVHPFRFLFLWLTINVFVLISSGVFESTQQDFMTGFSEGTTNSGEGAKAAEAVSAKLQEAIQKYMNLLLVLSIPFLALATSWLFRKAKLNFAEHLVLNSFAYGESLIIGFLFFPLYVLDREHFMIIQMISLLVSILYLTYVYWSIFRQNFIVTFIKSIFVMILWFIGISLLIVVIMVAYFIFTVITNPELIEKYKKPETVLHLLETDLMPFIT